MYKVRHEKAGKEVKRCK